MDSMIVKVFVPICIDALIDNEPTRPAFFPVNWGLLGLTLPEEARPNPSDGVLLPFDEMREGEDWEDTARRICEEFAGVSIKPEHFVLRKLSLRLGCILVLAPFCLPDSLGCMTDHFIEMDRRPERIYSGLSLVSEFENHKWLLDGDARLAAKLFHEDHSRGWSVVENRFPITLGKSPGWQERNWLVGPQLDGGRLSLRRGRPRKSQSTPIIV